MEKKHFTLKYNPPRASFNADMSEEEAAIMKRHVGYWMSLQEQGIAVVFGPVLDPAGVYGLSIVEVDDSRQVDALIRQDPAIISGVMRPEYWPMQAVLPKRT